MAKTGKKGSKVSTRNNGTSNTNKKYWADFYKTDRLSEPSTFAQFCLPFIQGNMVDFGCGNGRDTYFFHNNGVPVIGVDASNEDLLILKQDVNAFMRENGPFNNLYTRFFWHAIDRETQLKILKWNTGRLFIEARTTLDRPLDIFGKHKRNLVNIEKLKKDLTDTGYAIKHFSFGYGMATFFNEDPHLVRVIADRVI